MRNTGCSRQKSIAEKCEMLKKTEKCIAVLFFCAVAVCGVLSFLFHAEINTSVYLEENTVYCWNTWKNVAAAIALGVVYIAAARVLKKLDRRIGLLIAVVCVVVIGAAAALWIRYNPLLPIADQKKLWDAIIAYADGDYQNIDAAYFDQYPFQSRLVVLFSVIVRITGIRTIMIFKAYNAAAAAAIAAGLMRISALLFSRMEMTLLTGIMTVCFLPIVIYSCFIYGTLLSLALIVWSFCCVVSFVKYGKEYKLFLLAVLMAGAGICYSGSAIAMIAAAIYLLYSAAAAFCRKAKGKAIACVVGIALMLVCSAASQKALSSCFTRTTGIPTDNGVPASAYVLMGVTSDEDNACGPGSYNATNVYIYEISDRDSNAANQEALKRLYYAEKDYLRGRRSLSFFVQKLRNEWTDSWFSSAVMTVYLQSEDSLLSEEQIRFFQSSFVVHLQGFLTAFLVVVYFFAVLSALRDIRKTDRDLNILSLFFLGGFVFYLFWEAKPRYCFPYFVCLIPLAASSIAQVSGRFFNRNRKVQNSTL